MCLVKESPNHEFEKSRGAEISNDEPNLSVTSPSPKDAKVEFDAKNDDNATDTTATECKGSEEVITLDKKLEESFLCQREGGQPASQCWGGTSIPENSPEGDTHVQNQPEGKIKAQPAREIALFPVYMLKIYRYKFHCSTCVSNFFSLCLLQCLFNCLSMPISMCAKHFPLVWY